jgi:hypothetical protein
MCHCKRERKAVGVRKKSAEKYVWALLEGSNRRLEKMHDNDLHDTYSLSNIITI